MYDSSKMASSTWPTSAVRSSRRGKLALPLIARANFSTDVVAIADCVRKSVPSVMTQLLKDVGLGYLVDPAKPLHPA